MVGKDAIAAYKTYTLETMKEYFQSPNAPLFVEMDSVILSLSAELPKMIRYMRSLADQIVLTEPPRGYLNFKYKGFEFQCQLKTENA